MVDYSKFDKIVDSDDEVEATTAATAPSSEPLASEPPELEDEPEVVVPEELLCPMLQTVFRDPVVNSSGNTYERESLYKFWEGSKGELRDPLTNVVLVDANTIPNWDMRRRVQYFIDANPNYVPDGWPMRTLPPARGAEVWPGAAQRFRKCSDSRSVGDSPIDVRLSFVRKVYGVLALQVLLTMLVAKLVFVVGDPETLRQCYTANAALLLLMLVQFSDGSFPQAARSFPKNLVIVLLLAQQQAILAGYMEQVLGWEHVWQGAGSLLFTLAVLSIYTFTSVADFTGRSPHALNVICAIISGVLGCSLLHFSGTGVNWSCILLNFLATVLLGSWAIYELQRILGAWGGHSIEFAVSDYVFAALILYYDCVEIIASAVRRHLPSLPTPKPQAEAPRELTDDQLKLRAMIEKMAERRLAEQRLAERKCVTEG